MATTIDEAIQTLQAARDVLGGDSLLGLAVTGGGGFTTGEVQFVGPVEIASHPGRAAILVAAAEPKAVP